MSESYITPHDSQIAADILEWARTYLMVENENIKRPHGTQVVCPFIKTSVEGNYFYMAFHREISGENVLQMREVILQHAPTFQITHPVDEKQRIRKALLIVFPKLTPTNYASLDVCHQMVKPLLVKEGLMVGQFHPKCKEPAFYNPSFRKVSVSPHPLMALRHMAIHDIIFLKNDVVWFDRYNRQFGHKFNDPESIPDHDKHLINHFNEARERFLTR